MTVGSTARRGVGAAAAAVMLGGMALAGPTSAESGNKYPSSTDTHDCGDGDTIAFKGAKTLWPPNHKYQPTTITARSGDPMEQVSLSTTAASDEVMGGVEMNGAGHTAMDADPAAASDSGTGSASVTHQLRAERSGRGDGRTYTIEAMAMFGMKSCTQTFEVDVPHDQRGGAGWR